MVALERRVASNSFLGPIENTIRGEAFAKRSPRRLRRRFVLGETATPKGAVERGG
jgi:hypothetical protein